MKSFPCFWTILLLVLTLPPLAGQHPGTLAFEVSMEQAATHYYHVDLTCEGLKGKSLDFKLPAWTPGYYWIINYAKNVVRFQARDAQGKLLSWEKTSKNTWQVVKGRAEVIHLSYDVYAFNQSVAEPFLDLSHGYIAPAGLLMYPEGELQHPVSVTLKPHPDFPTISTGLDPVPGQVNTYAAANFDELYDCPFYLGDQTVWSFEVQGIRHEVAVENPDAFERDAFLADLRKMVEAAVAVIGAIPYKHYTFIIMGEGRGGLEHRNSTAVFSHAKVYDPRDAAGYKRWLGFLTHEYFHLYNVKSIRPYALGPFDYEQENYTRMLWVSEGFTVYYEYLILQRAGLMTREEVLEQISSAISNYENIPGHLVQSATEASFDTWIQFFNRGDNAANTTISYYDKGCALGMLLDLKIRHATQNRRSLDDVMRALYRTFYLEKGRGFTDEEFRQVCEKTAGISLAEIFEYASTVKEVDYAKYLAYAGLQIDTAGGSFKMTPLPGATPAQAVLLEAWLR